MIAAYAHGGTTLVLIVVLVATGWSYGCPAAAGAGALAAQPRLPRGGPGTRRAALYIIVVEILPTMTSLIVASFLGAAPCTRC